MLSKVKAKALYGKAYIARPRLNLTAWLEQQAQAYYSANVCSMMLDDQAYISGHYKTLYSCLLSSENPMSRNEAQALSLRPRPKPIRPWTEPCPLGPRPRLGLQHFGLHYKAKGQPKTKAKVKIIMKTVSSSGCDTFLCVQILYMGVAMYAPSVAMEAGQYHAIFSLINLHYSCNNAVIQRRTTLVVTSE